MDYKLSKENIADIEKAINKSGGAAKVIVGIENKEIVVLRIDVKRVG